MAEHGLLTEQVEDLTARLHFTDDDVGRIVDASSRSVSRWRAGERAPQRISKQRLLELHYVANQASSVMPAARVNLWMFTPNQLLDHDTPSERIRTGHYRDVLDLIDAIADGVVV
ncbi:antitoxin Xre/MbcA/ParS toxin-binding domain-containing protein [Candidatus Neomicrothrix sp.]|uniref:antitoxin Xre/MbcA/ParS toxin-binding domain-containing protein n=1 Tax=Candidatus Neomicrothrix sp. TaxID=2719034 RepID=UPI001B73953B|nr:antitoxin Xre/MbcA/ParS toxin-binding domain-containing protein [Candidatus Microthrix sp.]MBP6136724.1 DUF2384 domain-containing protein [Candidatus Microthrix sp.]